MRRIRCHALGILDCMCLQNIHGRYLWGERRDTRKGGDNLHETKIGSSVKCVQ